jgi:hypothetical protein
MIVSLVHLIFQHYFYPKKAKEIKRGLETPHLEGIIDVITSCHAHIPNHPIKDWI